MDDETILIIAAVGVAALALGPGLQSAGQGIENVGTSVGTGITDVTGIIPFAESQLTSFESWLGRLF